jgi:heme-degrading monooxygenase HmoA
MTEGTPMAEVETTGTWMVDEAKQDAFVQAWAEFAVRASTMPGATTLTLGRDAGSPRRFVSFGPWDTADAAHAWKTNPEFKEHLANVLQHVDDFHNEELVVVATATAGARV